MSSSETNRLTHCTHCGGEVLPYEPCSCDVDFWLKLNEDSTLVFRETMPDGVVHYWCNACESNWLAVHYGMTAGKRDCGHFCPPFAENCPQCGNPGSLKHHTLERCENCFSVLSNPNDRCQYCGHPIEESLSADVGTIAPDTTPPTGIDDHVHRLLSEIAKQSHFEERYEIRETLAAGGMGEIFRAYDRIMCREVAIKMMRYHNFIDTALREQFLKEARVGGRLLHPNILAVFDVGVNRSEQTYFTMRLVDGSSLAHCLDSLHRGAMTKMISFPLRKMIDAFMRACQGVDYAHENRILHLDLKPQNILISGFREIFVIDWGLARVDNVDDTENLAGIYRHRDSDDGAAFLTQVHAGGIIGTPGYMAPEQVTGDTLDETTDLFALGGILYYILYGQPPNRGQSVCAMLVSVMEPKQRAPLREGILPRGRRIRHEVRAAIDALECLCLKALSPAKDDRFANVEQLIIELDEWLTQTAGVIVE